MAKAAEATISRNTSVSLWLVLISMGMVGAGALAWSNIGHRVDNVQRDTIQNGKDIAKLSVLLAEITSELQIEVAEAFRERNSLRGVPRRAIGGITP